MEKQKKAWDDARRAGLAAEISHIDDYNSRVTTNLAHTVSALKGMPAFVTDPTHVKKLHGTYFEGISPWAGKFSTTVNNVGSAIGADPQRYEAEFRLLKRQVALMAATQGDADDALKLTRIAAFHHARFESIHAFDDGNGRLGRLITNRALQAISGGPPTQQVSKSEYITALRAATEQHNLAPLSDIFARTYLGRSETTKFLPSPFRIPPIHDVTPVTIDQDIDRTSREDLSTIAAQDTPLVRPWLQGFNFAALIEQAGGKKSRTFENAKGEIESLKKTSSTLAEGIAAVSAIKDSKPFERAMLFIKPNDTAWAITTVAALKNFTASLDQQRRTALESIITSYIDSQPPRIPTAHLDRKIQQVIEQQPLAKDLIFEKARPANTAVLSDTRRAERLKENEFSR